MAKQNCSLIYLGYNSSFLSFFEFFFLHWYNALAVFGDSVSLCMLVLGVAIVGGVKDNVVKFTSASDDLTVATEKASGTMDNLSIAIAEVAKGASVQETAGSLNDIKDITKTVTDKAGRIKDLSEKLGQMVGGFKV